MSLRVFMPAFVGTVGNIKVWFKRLHRLLNAHRYLTIKHRMVLMSESPRGIVPGMQCCGSGSARIRIHFGRLDPDPDSLGNRDPGPGGPK
jgi:hypothetical protein